MQRARYIFLDVYKTFTSAAKHWNEFKDKKVQKAVKKAKQQAELAKTKKLSAKQRRELQQKTTIDLGSLGP